MKSNPRLWLSAACRDRLLAGNIPSALAWDAGPIDSWPDESMQWAAEGLLKADAASAHKALSVWREGIAAWNDGVQDLGKAHAALAAAVIYDAVGMFWAPASLADWRSDTTGLVRSFYSISSGNPHSITNNWWAVTHAGLYCAVAALRASGAGDAPGLRPLGEIEEWAWRRLDAFLGHFGDGGAYHEGLGYQEYTSAYLVPAALLRQARTGTDLAEKFPGLQKMATLIFLSAIEGPHLDDITGERVGWGRQLSWNDAGLGWPDSAVALMSIAWADPARRGALFRRWERLGGFDRPDMRPATRYGARFFQAVCSPEGIPSGDAPAGALPLQICDRKQGLWFARNRHRDKDDAVLGAYARCQHPGGHWQDDAGSFRFSALGWDWVLGGGQARPEARWQSVVTSGDPPSEACCGVVLWEADNVFGMDLRRVHQSYSERYLALHPDGPIAVAVLDLIDDHRTDRDWTWNMTFSPEMKCSVEADGFVLTAPDGATLEAKFLGVQPVGIFVESSVPTTRTYANGHSASYISRPAARARFPRLSPLNIYTTLTVRPPGTLPLPPVVSDGLDIAWGDAVWRRPFGVAFPQGAVPGGIGSPSRFPA